MITKARFPRSRKPNVCNFAPRNSRAGNGYANLMGAWDFWSFLQANLHAHKTVLGLLCGSGSADVIFMGAWTPSKP